MTDHAKAAEVAAIELTDGQVDRITSAVLAEPEQGRLDRILAEQAAKPYLPDPQAWWTAPTVRERYDATIAENLRLRSMVIALEAECALLAGALTATTHAHVPAPGPVDRGCWAPHTDPLLAEQDVLCGFLPDHPIHRTPAIVQAELEER